MANVDCYRCGQFGHVAAMCHELRPASSEAEHRSRIAAYRQRFQNWLEGAGGIRWDPMQKTTAIEMENRMWEKEKAK